MNGFETDNSVYFLFADGYSSAEHNTLVNSADSLKAECSVGIYACYHESYLVHMSVEHNLVFRRFLAFLEHDKVAERVNLIAFGTVLYFIYNKLSYVVLSARGSVEKRKLLYKFKH